ncbi:uncharacterized protein [Engystomops pustulosus]|uniref:uncharacterized protein n=1 Tax=Engystomops pustulosus TaxID=76066 RepID=UPI003AFAF81F
MALSKHESLLNRIHLYTPNPPYEWVSLQLFGMLGHGKSSLVNTCLYVVRRGDFRNVAGSGKSNFPITMERNDYILTPKVHITDNRGLNMMTPEELEGISAQMSQLRSYSRVEWNRSIREKLDLIPEQFHHRPTEIIVPVFVYSVESLLTNERYEELEPFIRQSHNITGIYPIVVLTKVGENRDLASDNFNKFRKIGATNIFQVENYTVEKHERNPETESQILTFLITCLQEADNRRTSRDPQYEFIHGAMEAVHDIIQRTDERHQARENINEARIRDLEETMETNKEEIGRLRQKCEDQEQELQRGIKRKKNKCRVM